jgi:hypothetical protein
MAVQGINYCLPTRGIVFSCEHVHTGQNYVILRIWSRLADCVLALCSVNDSFELMRQCQIKELPKLCVTLEFEETFIDHLAAGAG